METSDKFILGGFLKGEQFERFMCLFLQSHNSITLTMFQK